MPARWKAATALKMILLILLLPACDGMQSALAPASDGAASIARLWWVMFWGTGVIMLIVIGLTIYTVFRKPGKPMPVSPRTVLIVGGLLWPASVILALLFYAVPLGHNLLPLPDDRDVLRVDVTGHQWWWEISYPDAEGGPVYTANELHIPAGRPVDLTIRGADVIHSFWIPRLAGKIDAMPGSPNRLRLEAREPGVFRGQCAEFCGAQHARMAVYVTAHTEEDFLRQLGALQRAPAGAGEAPGAAPPATAGVDSGGNPEPGQADDQALETPGQTAFNMFCAQCHSVDPRVPGPHGPNLATVAARDFLGAGTVRNTDGALLDWLQRHQEYKPGNRMPSHDQLSEEVLADIVAFLEDIQ